MPDFVNPIEVLDQLDLRESMIAADFGSGSGGWTIPLAKRLKQGRVWAIDLQDEPLSVLMAKARSQGLSNIKKLISNIEKPVMDIRNMSCDWVLMTDLLFETDDDSAIFQEASRILKPGGKILVVDWKPDASVGPKEGKMSAEQVEQVAGTHFILDKKFKAGDYHYALVFTKKEV